MLKISIALEIVGVLYRRSSSSCSAERRGVVMARGSPASFPQDRGCVGTAARQLTATRSTGPARRIDAGVAGGRRGESRAGASICVSLWREMNCKPRDIRSKMKPGRSRPGAGATRCGRNWSIRYRCGGSGGRARRRRRRSPSSPGSAGRRAVASCRRSASATSRWRRTPRFASSCWPPPCGSARCRGWAIAGGGSRWRCRAPWWSP